MPTTVSRALELQEEMCPTCGPATRPPSVAPRRRAVAIGALKVDPVGPRREITERVKELRRAYLQLREPVAKDAPMLF
jgi:hypothetical protein